MHQNPAPDITPFTIAEAAQRKAVQARKRKLRKKAAATASTAMAPPNSQRTASLKSLRAPMRSARQQLGDHYETRAWEVLQEAGCSLLARQLRCPLGELDLIVREGQTLVFVEVRYRSSSRFGDAAASVTPAKQARLLRAIHWWLPTIVQRAFGGQMPPCRIDLAAFDPSGLTWHRDAVRLDQDK
ncbi:YraN family protein [Zwartia sp.]|uniref:YraN family protein n=1 Tax=Zwartia sp. TaxID=2978004 RepID=UPI00271D6EE1|nr:YraN family protein [Zwartia sp.]MDO9025636.1 YraN family protein [Zwartia sp.]